MTLFDYRCDDLEFQGRLCLRDNTPRPTVLVAHTWAGRSATEDQRARQLTELGYHGFALDLYGAGVLGTDPETCAALMQPFIDDRTIAVRRIDAAVRALRGRPEVADQPLAIIGFCFGGQCALDYARSGADIRAAISFHGLLAPASELTSATITASILVLHGWEDPMALPDKVLALSAELTNRSADWQLVAFGHQMHAFTNPIAASPEDGLMYDPRTEQRAFRYMTQHLHETLGEPTQ